MTIETAMLWPVVGSLAAVVIDGTSMMPLGAAAGVIGTVIVLTRKWTKVEDKIDNMDRRMSSIEKLIQDRPCFSAKPSSCPLPLESTTKP